MSLAVWVAALAGLYLAVSLWLTFGFGPFRFVYNPLVGWFLGRLEVDGITLFSRCFSRTRKLIEDFPLGLEPLHLPEKGWQRKWWRHERQHNHQFRVRPFMAPVYLFWNLLRGYKDNPLEHEAEREE